MSDLQREIEIIFMGVDNVSETLGRMGTNVEKFGNTLEDIGDPFKKISEGVLALDVIVAGLAATALAARSAIEAETTKMGNALNVPTEKVEEFAEVARTVYKEGFGENVEEVFQAVTQASQRFKDASVSDIEKIVASSFKLSESFGSDYTQNLGAVQTLMKDFGLSSDEAFNFVASGFQKGLNASGDFLESITEYSTQFANGGADAGQFFSVLETGLQNGVLGTDKAADMFKEFRVRIQDESESTTEALKSIGIDPVEFGKNMASGKTTAAEAFELIQQKLNATQDKTVQFNAGVALMGTQFEDMGTKSALAVSTTTTKLSDMSGAMASINPDESLGKKFTQAMRTIQDTITDAPFWDGVEERLKVRFDDIKKSFEIAFKGTDFSDLESAFGNLINKISSELGDIDLDITTVEGMSNAIDLVKNAVISLLNITGGITEAVSPIILFAKDAVEWFVKLSPETQQLAGYMVGLGTALSIVGGIVGAGGVLIGGIGNVTGLIKNLSDAVQPGGALHAGFQVLQQDVTSLSKLQQIGAIAISFSVGWKIGGAIRENFAIDEYVQKAIREVDKVINFTGQMGEVDLGDFDKDRQIKIKAELEATQKLTDFFEELDNAEITVRADLEVEAALDEFFSDLDSYENNYRAVLKFDADSGSIEGVKTELEQAGIYEATTADGKAIKIDVVTQSKDIDKVKKDIEEIPHEKLLEIKLQGEIDKEIAQIEASANMASAAFEWTAKVDIAEAESSSKVLVAAYDAVGQSVSSLAESTSDMFSSLVSSWSTLDTGARWDFMDILENNQKQQDKILDSQIKLNDAQAEYLKRKAESLRNGDGLIKIDTTGLEPALDILFWAVIDKVKMKTTEEYAEYLLGIKDITA